MFQQERRLCLFGAACTFLFILLRVVYLEWDLPSIEVANYFVEDELFYAAGGFNLFHYGAIDYQHFDWVKPDSTYISSPTNAFLSFLGLTLFGNNFYALRVPAAAAGLLVFTLIFGLLTTMEAERRQHNKIALIIALVFVTVNFSFVMASRIFEPTIFRMAGMMLCLFLAVKFTPVDRLLTPSVSVLLGLISGVAFIFIYLTNFFIPVAVVFGVFCVSLLYGVKQALSRALYCLLGVILGVLFYNLYSILLFDKSPLSGFMGFFNVYQKRTALSDIDNPIVVKLITNIFKTSASNIFRLNSALFFIFLLTVPLHIYLVVSRRKVVDIYLFSFWLLFSLQSVFVNDFPIRKQIILLPLVLLITYRCYQYRNELLLWLHSSKKLKTIAAVYGVVVLLFSIDHIFVMSGVSGWGDVKVDTSRSHPVMAMSVGSLFFTALLIFNWYRRKTAVNNIVIYLVVFAIILPELFLDYRYIFKNPTFKRRDAMLEVGSLVDGKRVVGCESIAMRLYNNATVFLSPFRYLEIDTDKTKMHEKEYGEVVRRLIKENQIDYAFCRLNETRFDMEAMNFELVKVYQINADTERAMGLYRPRNQPY